MGHGPFFPNPITGEPGIWYLSGQGRSTIDAHGNVTSAKLMGRLVDLCPQLAGLAGHVPGVGVEPTRP